MKTRCLIGALAFLALGTFAASAKAPKVGDFSLLDQRGVYHQLSRYSDQKAVVIFVQGNSCPIVRLSLPALNELKEKYAEQGVVFLMLNANVQDDLKSIRKEVAEFTIDFPILKDDTQLVAESLDITRTGEVLVILPESRELVYRGPIDDKIGYESQKEGAAKKTFLADALAAVLEGKEVAFKAPEAKGCAISFPTKTADAKRKISYKDEVAPIVMERCAQCHIEGGIGPFAMKDHKSMQGWGAMMVETVMTLRMPPGQIDMEYGKWRDVHFMTEKEKQTLVHWFNAGAAKDEGEDPLTKVVAIENGHWSMGKPDHIIVLPPFEVPADGVLPQPSITVPLNLTEERWVRAYEFNIDHRDVCHHITSSMVIIDPNAPARQRPAAAPQGDAPARVAGAERPAAEGVARAEGAAAERPARARRPAAADGDTPVVDADDPDAADPRGARSQGFAGYAPGKPIAVYPEGVGYRVVPNMAFRASLHYTTNGKPVTDNSKVGLYFYPKEAPPKYEIKRWSAGTSSIKIPPQTHEYPVSGVSTVREDTYLFNMQPHMHYRGKHVRYTAEFPDGTQQVLLNVPNYSYLWQMIYTPEEPIFLPKGTKVIVSGAFDNSAMNPHNPDPSQEVRNGAQTWQEMFIGHMQVGPAKGIQTVSARQ